MKNYTLLLAFICIITSVTAQVNNQAIGVRLGGGDGEEGASG